MNLLGVTLAEDGRPAEAISQFDNAIRTAPDLMDAWWNRGLTLSDLGLLPAALESFERTVTHRPGNSTGLVMLGVTLARMGRFDDALLAYDRVLALTGMTADLASNRGIALAGAGRTDAAMASFNLALSLDPDLADAKANKSYLSMLLGDFPTGTRLFEWRWRSGRLTPKRAWTRPLWLGESCLVGKTLLLHDEQGFGDTLQFCRYAMRAEQAGAQVILMVEAPLATLMRTLPGVSRVLTFADETPDHDLQCPLMSLPLAFGTTLDTIPANIPYLHADPARVGAWRSRLADLPGSRIGLVWAGSSRMGQAVSVATDQRRSVRLSALAPLASVPGCSFVSLQVGPPGREARSPPAGMILRDPTSELLDFAETAALVANLDLVISVDTAVVHLAGAMGKPVWLLNRFDTCWRWLLNRDDSPWYPSLRQFRQPRSGDWDTVIRGVRDALLAKARTDTPFVNAMTGEHDRSNRLQ